MMTALPGAEEDPQVKIVRLGDCYFDLHAPAERARVSPTALASFFALMSEWEVAPAEARILLGRLASEQFEQWRAAPATLDPNKLKRIATLLSIQRELRLLYGAGVAGQWVRLPNAHAMFCRVRPITYMVIGGLPAMSNVLRLLAKHRRAASRMPAQEVSSALSTLRQD